MTLTNFSTDDPAAASIPAIAASNQAAQRPRGFTDRRAPQHDSGNKGSANRERRQFGSTHAELSAAGRELAAAIDRYKLQHHRRYITCDEMLTVLHQIGYERTGDPA